MDRNTDHAGKQMKIYIIRHGETDMNARAVMQGWMDEPLNTSGRDLAVITGRAMRGIHFDGCFSSPLIRAKETAEIVLRESGNDIPIVTDDRLREISFGVMEGRKLEEMGEAGLLFFTDPFRFEGFPNGETVRDVCRRNQDFLMELSARNDGKTYLIGSHGCALRAMVNSLYPDPSDFWRGHAPYNCSVTIVEVRGGVPQLVEEDKVFYDPELIVDHYRR